MVHIEELADMLDQIDAETEIYYFPAEERYVIVNVWEREDISDADLQQMYRLPDKHELDDYGDMVRFIETLEDEEAAEWLSNAIHGKGAFRMFRAACERFHLTSDWYDFRDRMRRQKAVRWCEQYGLMYDYENPDVEEEDDSFDDEEWMHGERKEPEKKTAVPEENDIRIVDVTKRNAAVIEYMMDDFLKEYPAVNLDAQSRQDIYLNDPEKYFVCAAMDKGRALGYFAAEKKEDAMVLKEIYVRKNERRSGIGRALLQEAQAIAMDAELALSIPMDPSAAVMIRFLKACGYDVLKTIEIVKGSESAETKYKLNDFSFRKDV